MAELVPAPLPHLLRRLFREHEREGKVFDLPARKFWHGDPALDTSVAFHGRRASTPVGPAAGPHGQMAQNIALAWLAGSRILELKTVQIKDRLTIPRPCIDIATVGYNVEWSQELRLEESLREYVKGSMLVDVMREVNLPGRPADAEKDETLFDMSVGYDLAGIRSPEVRTWIETMKDAGSIVDELRKEIPPEHHRFRDLDFTTRLSEQITLSTFHGCPAGEIEGIVRFLLTELQVDVTVKLNPTLLGKQRVDGLLHDVLGYREIETRREDFEKDLQWEQALEIVDRLGDLARSLGRTLGVKLSNTLVVRNHRAVFPRGEAVQYLSGQPLHVITLSLLDEFRRARADVPVSFSAGVDGRNFAACVALGLVPVTTCTDLLRAGGYGRLPKYLDNLEERMRSLGVRNIGDYVVKALGQGEAAIRAAIPDPELQSALVASLSSSDVDLRSVLESARRTPLHDALVRRAAALNTPLVAAAAAADPRYRAEANRKPPRKIGSRLALFDCINCDKCLPVCPNDANFSYEVAPARLAYRNYRVSGGRIEECEGGIFELKAGHQIANFQDFCNDCGNCDTFCPEDGGPYIEKPRFFGSLDAWKAQAPRDGIFVRRAGEVDAAWGRVRGAEYHLEVDRERDRALFTDGVARVELRHSERRPLSASARPHADDRVLDMAVYLSLAAAVDGVLDPSRANPVNVAGSDL